MNTSRCFVADHDKRTASTDFHLTFYEDNIVFVLRQWYVTAKLLETQLQQTDGIQVSTDTIHNLTPQIPARGPTWTPQHRRGKLSFASKHIDWSDEDWERILLSDFVCTIQIDEYNYRRPSEIWAQCNFLDTTSIWRRFGYVL